LQNIETVLGALKEHIEIEDEPVLLERLFVLSKRLLVRADRLTACLKILQFPQSDQVAVFKYAYGLAIDCSDAELKKELLLVGTQLQHYLYV
jgi:hypothetical protein